MTTFEQFHEHPDGTVSVGESEVRLTVEDFRKLQRLMPDVRWFGFVFPRPHDILNDAYRPYPEHEEFLENYKQDPTKFLTFNKPNNGN